MERIRLLGLVGRIPGIWADNAGISEGLFSSEWFNMLPFGERWLMAGLCRWAFFNWMKKADVHMGLFAPQWFNCEPFGERWLLAGLCRWTVHSWMRKIPKKKKKDLERTNAGSACRNRHCCACCW